MELIRQLRQAAGRRSETFAHYMAYYNTMNLADASMNEQRCLRGVHQALLDTIVQEYLKDVEAWKMLTKHIPEDDPQLLRHLYGEQLRMEVERRIMGLQEPVADINYQDE